MQFFLETFQFLEESILNFKLLWETDGFSRNSRIMQHYKIVLRRVDTGVADDNENNLLKMLLTLLTEIPWSSSAAARSCPIVAHRYSILHTN